VNRGAFLVEFMDFLRAAGNRKRKDPVLEKQYLNAARTDLKACRILYGRSMYSLSVYHLQQAMEKSSKAWILYLGVITEDDLKRPIGHRTPRAFLKLLNESDIGKMTRGLIEYLNLRVSTDTSGYRDLVERKYSEITAMDYESIKVLLDILDKIEKAVAEQLKELKPLLKSFEVPDSILEVPIAFAYLWLVASITFPHSETTRYPSKNFGPSDYTQDLGIVKALPELVKIAEKCVNTISQYINI